MWKAIQPSAPTHHPVGFINSGGCDWFWVASPSDLLLLDQGLVQGSSDSESVCFGVYGGVKEWDVLFLFQTFCFTNTEASHLPRCSCQFQKKPMRSASRGLRNNSLLSYDPKAFRGLHNHLLSDLLYCVHLHVIGIQAVGSVQLISWFGDPVEFNNVKLQDCVHV